MKNKKAVKTKEYNKKPRHRIHSIEKHYYSIWLDLELMAKLRILSKKVGKPISDIITDKMVSLVEGIKLTAEAKEWMALRRAINENRKS